MTLKDELSNFKDGQLVPAIIQDGQTDTVLMLGYMNPQALERTLETRKVTFFSRSKQRLWTKGESSGHFLNYVSHSWDCDRDTILLRVTPQGPTCHNGTDTCWGFKNKSAYGFLGNLEEIIASRVEEDTSNSYVAQLNRSGLDKIAQKVGEEAVEVVIASKNTDETEFIDETADLIFHLLLLINKRGLTLDRIVQQLAKRH